jgi:pimeloyl-ACP methyl ester carboxylesterase
VTELRRVPLSTGVTLNVAIAGNRARPPVILLHGFPESHRTWRALASTLQDQLYLIMPDQRGFAASDLPQDVGEYETAKLVDDVFALADSLDVERFVLVGHDWGGAIAWAAAVRGDARLTRLAIINSPHPAIFQRSLIEDEAQRAASQYINAFRAPGFEKLVQAKSYDWFFERTFCGHVDLNLIGEAERAQYLADWSRPGAFNAMLNWYRAGRMVVPPPGEKVPLPDWLLRPFPEVTIPTLVVWGMRDPALLPVQLDGLDELVENLTVVRLPNAGHFAPWEAADEVASALEPFLTRDAEASAPAS